MIFFWENKYRFDSHLQSNVGTCWAIFSVNKIQAMTKISVLRSEMCKKFKTSSFIYHESCAYFPQEKTPVSEIKFSRLSACQSSGKVSITSIERFNLYILFFINKHTTHKLL